MSIRYKLSNRLFWGLFLVFLTVHSLSASEWFADDEMEDTAKPTPIHHKGNMAKRRSSFWTALFTGRTQHTESSNTLDMPEDARRGLVLSAVLEGNIDLLRKVYKYGPYDLNEVFSYDFAALQPIHIAIVCGHLNIVRYLIEERGMSVNHKQRFSFSLDHWLLDGVDFTLLHVAIVERKFSIVKYLVDEADASLHIKVGGEAGMSLVKLARSKVAIRARLETAELAKEIATEGNKIACFLEERIKNEKCALYKQAKHFMHLLATKQALWLALVQHTCTMERALPKQGLPAFIFGSATVCLLGYIGYKILRH